MDLKISQLPALTGALLQAADPLAVADLSASETKKISAGELAAGLGPLFPPGSINSSAVTVTVPAGSITTVELADHAVTAVKLADDSSTTVGAALPAAGVFVGQLAVETTGNTAHVWTGASWVPFKAGGSVNTIGVDNTLGPIHIGATQAGDSITLGVVPKDTSAAAQFMAGPTGAGGAVGYRVIEGTDLPIASATVRGGVQVSGDGLRMDTGKIEIDNDIAATGGIYGLVDVNGKGLVVGTRAIDASDLPLATNSTIGAVRPGVGLQMGVSGDIGHPITVVGGGTFAKVSVDSAGHVTAGTVLTPSDIPDLDASKITTGEFTTDRLADHSVTALKLADYATAYIQDVQPPNAGNTIGQLWLNPLAQQIRMWDGNVWVPIGVGALSEQNLRFSGLFDATNGQITILTQFGRDAGFKVGDTIPVATDQLTGVYFVCQVPGNAVGQDAGVTYDAGDWIVCLGVAQGWERVDTLNGAGGGGGGASVLDDLTDVNAPSPSAGQVLEYDGAVWKPVATPDATTTQKGRIELATQAEVDAGTDAVRAVTPATLKQYVATKAPTPPDATTAVKGVVQFADATSIATGDATRGVTADQLKTTNDAVAANTTSIGTINTSITTINGKVVDATTAVKGIVQLADAAAVTAGTAGRVVTADQLKATNDALATATAGGLSNVTGTAPVVVTGIGNTRDVSVSDASASAKGIVELATAAEVGTGTDTVRAVTPAGIAAHYLKKNISLLPALP